MLHPSSWIEHAGDRLNPVLVKEVRAALRGRVFRVGFVLVLSFALIASVVTVDPARAHAPNGLPLFLTLVLGLAVVAQVLVPLSAFLSVTSEWDEGAADALLLTPLGARRILYGKLMAALVQLALHACTLVPFMFLTTLMEGVDLRLAAAMLGHVVVGAGALVCLALGLGAHARSRVVRPILLLVLLAAGLWYSQAPAMWMVMMTRSLPPGAFASLPPVWSMLLVSPVLITVALLGFTSAQAGFTHPHGNRSTPVRAATTFIVLWSFTYPLAVRLLPGLTSLPLVTPGATLTTVALVAAVGVFVVTEPDALPRGVRVPRSRVLRTLATPYLPGGGRGVLFLWSHLLLCALGSTLLYLAETGRAGWAGAPLAALTAGALVSIFVVLPASMLAHTRAPRLRRRVVTATSLAVLLLPAAGNLARHVISGPFIGDLGDTWSSLAMLRRHGVLVAVWTVAFLSSVVLGLGRALAGVREVAARRTARSSGEPRSTPTPEPHDASG